MRETWVQSLGWEDPLEKEKATHSNILVWKIPWASPWGREESDTIERLSLYSCVHSAVYWASYLAIRCFSILNL